MSPTPIVPQGARPAAATLLRSLVAVLVLLVGLTACGGTTPASESVPALADHLAEVDAAIAEEDYSAAREAVDALVATTAKARVAGDLTSEQADRVLAAATRVLEELPEGNADDDAGDAPGELPVPSPSAVLQGEDDDVDDEDDADSKKGNDKSKDSSKKDKSKKKDKSRDD